MDAAHTSVGCQVIPSSGAIYSTSDEGGRVFFYSSLNIEWSSKWKWKVYLGDLVAVSTLAADNKNTSVSAKRQQQQHVQEIEKWEANHYKKASPHWKVGLVVALSKRLSKTVQGGRFDCHVQWLDKTMDLSTAESNSFKSLFRPFTARKGNKGSQLPNILINRPGDFGVICPLSILPVEIAVMGKQDFSTKGVLETDESQYSLKFCCLKTRRDGFLLKSDDKGIFNERDPDSWTFVNPPQIHNTTNSTSVVPISELPRPLESAWELWLSSNGMVNHSAVSLKQVFRKGWSTARRERYARTVLDYQAKEKELAKMRSQKTLGRIQRSAESSSKSGCGTKDATNRQTTTNQPRKRPISSKNDEKNEQLGQNEGSTLKKKKEIRFNSDTKQDTGKVAAATLAVPKTSARKRIRSEANQNERNRAKKGKSTTIVDDDSNSTSTIEGGSSTITQETHSTDTTLPTRGAGRKVLSKSKSLDQDEESSTVFTASSIATELSELLPQWKIVPFHPDPIYEAGNKKFYGCLKMSVSNDTLRRFLPEYEPDHLESVTFQYEIGSVVALYCDRAVTNDGSWSPFRLPWGVAQITNIFQNTNESDNFWKWQLGIKWFYRYPELTKTRQKLVQGSMDKSVGLLETNESMKCSAMSILPVHVALTVDRSFVVAHGHFEKLQTGHPIIHMLCEHISPSKFKIKSNSDWNINILNWQISAKSSAIPDPVKRAIAKAPKALKEKYSEWLQRHGRIDGGDAVRLALRNSTASSNTKHGSQAVISATAPIHEQWACSFYDSVKLQVDWDALHPKFTPKNSDWEVSVGMVIPVRCKNIHKKKAIYNEHFPFVVQWSPAQVVSLYKSASGAWMMEIRWFQRFSEILDIHKCSFGYLDNDHVVFETEIYNHVPIDNCLPGRIVLTSNDNLNPRVAQRSYVTGLPLIPLLCTHMCLDEEIDTSNDWENYDITLSSIPPPLSRGLSLTPANRANKEWIQILFRHYTTAIRSRQIDPEHGDLLKMRCEFQPSRGCVSHDYQPNKANITPFSPICPEMSTSVHFFRSLNIQSPNNSVAEPTLQMRRNKSHSFECAAGDVICFFDENATAADVCLTSPTLRHPFHPFRVPWSFGQILSIWKDSTRGLEAPTRVELRRFFRRRDLPPETISFLPFGHSKSDYEEVFESDVVINVDATHIVGLAEIFLGHHTASAASKNSFHVAQCRCKFFYMSRFQRFQPLFCSSVMPGDWRSALLRRGFNLSHVLEPHASIKEKMLPNKSDGNFQSNILDSVSPSKEETKDGCVASVKRPFLCPNTPGQCYEGVILRPQWSLFLTTEILFKLEEVEQCSWSLSIGDFLAVRSRKEPSLAARFPYKVNWSPCQLLSIFGEPGSMRFEVRVLEFLPEGERDEVTETGTVKTMEVAALDLLGPLCLKGRSTNDHATWTATYLPLAILWLSKSLNASATHALTFSKHYNSLDIPHVQKLLLSSRTCSAALAVNGSEQQKERLAGESWCVEEPFFVESSTGRVFFKKILLKPMFMELGSAALGKKYTDTLVLRQGDIVLAQFEGPKRHPFECNWAVADVVAIFTEVSVSVAHSLLQGGKSVDQLEGYELKAEIRWFYERHDFAGAAPTDGKGDEIFETDHTQIVDVGKVILSHASLLDSKCKFEKCDDKFKFLCQRFWSTQRKSLIPCGGLDGRQNRGLLYSKCLPSQFTEPQTSHYEKTCQKGRSVGWKDSMLTLQQKLSLKDASRQTKDDKNILVGREKEIKELLKFFRSAIRAESNVGDIKAAMIVAGPPGVGKTASVHAAISKLLKEQDDGIVPKFRFIALNGMEQRHPFDTYIRFWEALTGKKHNGSHDRACELLEEYFTTSSPFPNDITTVLLLDEIDYLVTEKQSVIYNFFNWPKCAANVPQGRHLVVVGLSNTLNLVEQLIPSVQSRVGTEKCIFKAYSLQDTVNILKAKMAEASQDYNFFDDDAILFAAKKTAALSGDIRKAFQICRVAAETVTQEFEKQQEQHGHSPALHPRIRIGDVQKASQESFNKAIVTAISFCTPFQALLLVSVASLCRSTGREAGEFTVQDIVTKMEAVANGSGELQYLRPPNVNETLRLVNVLGEMNLVKLKTDKSLSGRSPWPAISLVVDDLALLKGFKNTPHKQLAEKYLPYLY
ncbi:cell division control protein 6 [Nitzschia inconspicua]|uniref:Cell division control protein 6 n=1 Tax=Nitzschia inconspicua TaxID=303405 RepID=A0A9K3L057_9STRA|nr:cell division control protein 6 [Nitzschia inconspicua]